MSQEAHQADVYLQFQQHEVTWSISTPPWMGCLSMAGSTRIKFASNHLYAWVDRGTVRVFEGVLPNNCTMSQPGLSEKKIPFMLNITLQDGFLSCSFCL